MTKPTPSPAGRRSFFTRMHAGVTSFAAVAFGGVALAQVKSTPAMRFEPARHEKDDWLDQIPGKHRVVFDATTPAALADALAFGGNYIRVNKAEYGLQNTDLAVVIIARHRATSLAYSDAMWAKYGKALAARAKLEDPKTKLAPTVNIYNVAGGGDASPNRGTTLDSLSKQGVQFGVCAVSTRGYATAASEAGFGKVDEIFADLAANLVTNARLVPAGIVAVNRAQERGYSLVTT